MTPKTMPDHSHHWKIEGPNGPRSTARCKKCGTEREFSNVLPAYSFWRRYPGQRYAGERGKA